MSRAATRLAIVAVIPIAQADAANAALAAAGHGEGAFAVIGYTAGEPSHAALHAWHCPALLAAIQTIPGVVYDVGTGNPITRTRDALAAHGATWDVSEE